jgi:hypothetical protein
MTAITFVEYVNAGYVHVSAFRLQTQLTRFSADEHFVSIRPRVESKAAALRTAEIRLRP